MRTVYKHLFSLTIIATAVFLASIATLYGSDVSLITKEELKSIMSDADVVILDVRQGRDWSSSEFKIQGAVRVDPNQISEWQENHSKEKKLILYCA